MFNFNELTIVQPNEPQRSRGSFVGIRKDKYLGKMVFTLPKGFDSFKEDYESVKKLFFAMYRTFEKFRKNGEKYLDERPNNKDNAEIKDNQGVYIFTDEDGNETILYSKIDLIDKIFQTYQELEIESLIQELGLVEDVDYSKIENYLDKGIYLNNNAIFVDQMVGYRNIVRGVPSELIELFCYIYKELASELEKELSEQIKEIAFNFSYKYLCQEQSLFSEHSFESTISILKDCLDNIHKMTAYKNHQYWDIYEAVEHFLYGNLEFDKDSNQGFWGINNFSYIWEEMCNYMIANNKEYRILYCDSNLPLNQYKQNLTKDYVWIDKNLIPNNPFYLDFNGLKRWIRPDIITKLILNNQFNENPLNIAIARKILSIKRMPVKSMISFGSNRLNVDISLNKSASEINNSNILEVSEVIFKLFVEKFSNLYRTKGIIQGSLKGYQYIPNGKYMFSLKNIPKDAYDEVYQDVLGRWKGNQQQEITFIIDWKYYSHNIFENKDYRSDNRVNASIIKSLAYDFCLSQIIDKPINNQFGIPFYDINADDIVVDGKVLDCNISLVKMNFLKIQEIYLNG
ncbi:hypothetical protein [Moraxella sp. ZY210820]|uniref:hypothetical protein n=1 Tax=unclassified Moraxella TaxID=2685852 RepID=UPI00273177B3|nr:hypothetical protein [Moraxella sp. ZY210820]WLF82932.1 hypothetical protein LU301_06475 [Moraxella sp. ZY210820]